MNIALIAHDNKKELMVQFCTAYCGILAQHTLCATATTGLQIGEATGLRIHRFLSFDHGGGQQIAARIAYNELDMVLCFSDPNQKVPDEDVANIFRLCDQNNIPYASNVATAEMLVLGLARGVVCAYNDRPWARSRLWLALFLACYGAAPLLTWDGPYCLLLGAAMMLTTAALWTRNMRLTRLLFLLNSPPVFAYNLIAGSYTGAAIEVAAFCSFALAVWRFDLRRPAAGPSSPA